MTTESVWQTVGPFFHEALPWEGGENMADASSKGAHIRLVITVTDGNGDLVPDGMFELWQADSFGSFDHPEDDRGQESDASFSNFGRIVIDKDNRFVVNTIIPGRVPGQGNSLQAPHINVAFFARGIVRRLISRIYFEGQGANDEDPLLNSIDAERRPTLMARQSKTDPSEWHWNLALQGDEETVFFSL
ncbi:MAG: protocatechuate 3,4-dioxygenase subunit alpha [Marinosulfonomonas sp.]|nr:protocatechuate 3,4-dioxygenase subunit alpha [Marinosulfonomonas sp.]